jgi:hypothetical protein
LFAWGEVDLRLPFCHYFRHFLLDNYQQKGIVKIAFGWGAKGNLEKGMREKATLSGAIRLHKHLCARGALKTIMFF